MIPIIVDSYFILENWEDSPFKLYMKSKYINHSRIVPLSRERFKSNGSVKLKTFPTI